MAASTKILTVSYGTFSCTLEGFDDSFHSMKAIAEYFRDLAQEDRYFGAEPPAPDAEMLAKIAEREISRRVEAQMDGKGIRLRADIAPTTDADADDADVAMPPKAEAPAAAHTSHESPSALMPAAPLMAAAVEADDGAVEDTPAAPLSMEAPAHPDAESVAAKLQRIRAVVGKTGPAADDSFEDAVVADDAPSLDDVMTADEEVTVTAEDILAEDDGAGEAAQAEAEAKAAEEAAQAEADAKAAEEAAQAEAEAKAAEEAAQAEADAKAAEEAAQAEADAKAAEEAAQAEADAKAAEEAAQAEAEAEDLSSNLNDIDVPVEAPKAPVRARIVRLRKDKPAEVIAEPAAEEAASDAAEDVAASSDTDITDRVTAALKTDVPAAETAVEDTIEAPAQDDVRAAVAAAMPAGSSLSADDEDDLLRELAAVTEDVVTLEDDHAPEVTEVVVEDVAEAAPEADVEITEDVAFEAETEVAAEIEVPDVDVVAEEDVAPEAADEDVAAEAAPETPDVVETPLRSGRRSLPITDDAAMSRIMTQTDEALNEPTGSRRRNAIAQLKAAVAATEAARQLGDKSGGDAEAQEPFREDLDQVVRPRRPSTPIETGELRSSRPRTTPLKLVASQRIDDGAMEEPEVQPRRVASSPVDAADASGFAEFAAQMGATELPDLLEAAAAYTSFVEGVEDFSRPQIMKKVQLTTDEEFSREDGLRSFGTLLRQGRISKVRNGRFQISEQTRFRPDARSA